MKPRLVRVRDAVRITARTRRITLSGVDIAALPTPDAFLKLFFPLPGQRVPILAPPVSRDVVSWYRSYLAMPDAVRPPMRTYTVRAHRPAAAEVDIDFVLHGPEGPGSRWAMHARPGDTVAFLGHQGVHCVPPGTRWQLLVGDETAIPAIASIIESAPPGTVIRAFVEADPSEWQRFSTAASADVEWFTDGLLDAVRTSVLPDGGYAWLAGESGLVRSVRRQLVGECGFDRRCVTFTGYWRRGMSEEDVGRAGLCRIAVGLPPDESD
jgi:NADPH-dependent ferric siderophore reductase